MYNQTTREMARIGWPCKGTSMKRLMISAHKVAMAIVMVMLCLAPMGTSATEKSKSSEESVFLKLIDSPQNWYAEQVEAGKDIYFSANFIFQATKLKTQQILIEYEQSVLYPRLKDLCDQIKQMGMTGDALIFVEMVRKLVNPDAEIQAQVAEEVVKRVSEFNNDPQNTPRGHYTSSEDLSRYFRGMQFLCKATFDVKVDQKWFAQRLYMLFPFETAVEILKGLAKPENSKALDNLNLISTFYERLVGPSDLPSFKGLINDHVSLTVEDVLAYARDKNIPKVNKAMGVGVQFLGERYCLHQSVIDNLTEAFLAHDPKINRKKVTDTLAINNVFFGKKSAKYEVLGLNQTPFNPDVAGASFYDLCLKTILDLPVVSSSKYSINTGAACLTALAEQTILVTKQTTLVPKSAPHEPDRDKKSVNIYVEPNIENFLKRLSLADKTISAICEQEPQTALYHTLINASKEQTPIASNTRDGATLTKRLARLPGDPTVTADVFFLNSRNEKGFVQWAIGPFEVERSFKDGAKAIGMEMVFFEGWNDTVQKGKITPMTNEDWKKLFLQGAYNKFQSLIKAP